MKKIQRNDMIKCDLCHRATCSLNCNKIDPSRLLRAIWFNNEEYISATLPDINPCSNCDAPCQTYCIHNGEIKIKEIVHKLYSIKTTTIKPYESYPRLKTDFFGFKMDNPFMLSSSVVGSTYDMCARAFEAGWAGVVFKTICLMDIHEVSPRFAAIKGEDKTIIGFKNIEQLSDKSLEENLETFKRLKKAYPNKLIIASIMGRDEHERELLAKKVTEAGVDGIELNFSCPNMKDDGLGSDVGQCPDLVEVYTACARKGSKLPILAKLTPNVAAMSPAAEAAKQGGANGISAINTIKSVIPQNSCENVIKNQICKTAIGGYSGESVKPIALRFISELYNNPNIQGMHISGMGGIESRNDAFDFISLGCNTLQVTTAVMQYGYRIIDDLCSGLNYFLEKMDIENIESIRGKGCNCITDLNKIERDKIILPKFDKSKCKGCGRCYISCMDGGHQAIKLDTDRKPTLDASKCVGCHLCTLVCPNQAIESSGVAIPKENLERLSRTKK